VGKLRQEKKELKAEVDRLEESVSTMTANIAKKDEELNTLRSERDELDEDVQYLEENIRKWNEHNQNVVQKWKGLYENLKQSVDKNGEKLRLAKQWTRAEK